MARLTEYNKDLCIEICEQIANGAHIKDVLASKDEYPTFQTWCNWKREHDELFDLYTRSIQDKSEMVTFEITQAMSDLKNGIIDPASARVIIDTLKWFAAKFYPKMFGDKVDVTSGDAPLQTNVATIPAEVLSKLIEKL